MVLGKYAINSTWYTYIPICLPYSDNRLLFWDFWFKTYPTYHSSPLLLWCNTVVGTKPLVDRSEINPALGAWFMIKFILLAQVPQAQYSFTVQYCGIKHHSFHFIRMEVVPGPAYIQCRTMAWNIIHFWHNILLNIQLLPHTYTKSTGYTYIFYAISILLQRVLNTCIIIFSSQHTYCLSFELIWV